MNYKKWLEDIEEREKASKKRFNKAVKTMEIGLYS